MQLDDTPNGSKPVSPDSDTHMTANVEQSVPLHRSQAAHSVVTVTLTPSCSPMDLRGPGDTGSSLNMDVFEEEDEEEEDEEMEVVIHTFQQPQALMQIPVNGD